MVNKRFAMTFRNRKGATGLTTVAMLLVVGLSAQRAVAQDVGSPLAATLSSNVQQPAASKAPLTITLQDAVERARANAPQFRSALTDQKIAQQGVWQARAGLLPLVQETTQFLYTQGNGTATPRYIANNGVHEYISQGNIHEVLGGAPIAELKRASAAALQARAKADIAARGLVVTVTTAYYGLIAAEKKFASTQLALKEAQRFLDVSKKLEGGGEVAKADTIKAQIQHNDRERDLYESQLAMDQARTGLAVLIFPDFNLNFTVVDDAQVTQILPSETEVREIALRNNPDLAGAAAALKVASGELFAARTAHLPSLALDYFYGIDASHFATRTDGIRNLGYSASATMNIPIWSWGATQSKVKQAQYRRDQARLELSFAERQILANIQTFFKEAELSGRQLQLLEASARLSEQSLRLTTLRYQSGEATVLEVVDAQNTLTQARNAFNDGQVRHKVAVAKLQTLTGAF